MAAYFTSRHITRPRFIKLSILVFCLISFTVIISPPINYQQFNKAVKPCRIVDISKIPREVLYVDDLKYEQWKNMSMDSPNISRSVLKENGCSSESQRIAYDGVLNLTRRIDCLKMNEDPNLRAVLKFAVIKIYERNFNMAEKSSFQNISNSVKHMEKIMNMSKLNNCILMEIIYTKDGKYPTIFSVVHPNDSNSRLDTSLHWGFMYKFKITLHSKGKSLIEHRFSIVGRVHNDLHVYQHTYGYDKKGGNINSSIKIQRKILNSVQNDETSMNENIQNKSKTTKFSIMTFNIRNVVTVQQDDQDGNHYKNRMKHIAQLCQKANPDIISFQEVRFNHGIAGDWGPSQVHHLANLLKDYQYIYQPTEVYGYVFPERIEEGLAIFSKYPIIANDYLLLSRDSSDGNDSHQRILLHAAVDIPYFGHVHVFNTHLSLSKNGRIRTVVEIWKHINKFKEPVFLMGDFNAEPNSDEIRYLSGNVSLKDTTTTKFKDTWMLTHSPTENGYTFSTLNEKLTKRIDMIFMNVHKNVTVKSTEVVDDDLRNEKAASDHAPVMAKFEGYKTP